MLITRIQLARSFFSRYLDIRDVRFVCSVEKIYNEKIESNAAQSGPNLLHRTKELIRAAAGRHAGRQFLSSSVHSVIKNARHAYTHAE